jgi:molybdopterin/thiamine biosynthesis adenylyltransferase
MTDSLIVPGWIREEIGIAARHDLETAGVLLCSVFESPTGHLRLLARQMRWVKEDAYKRRESDSLAISSDGYVEALGEAEKIGAACLWVHTHPGKNANPTQSEHDHIVDSQLADLFRIRTNSSYYGALVFSPRERGIAFTGFVEREGESRRTIKYMLEVGDRWRLTREFTCQNSSSLAQFDRNIRAFGDEIQKTLGHLHIGIVGCGGTGSSVGEQLARIGVRKFTLIDPDIISDSNTTRVYGSDPNSIGHPKVESLARHICQIAPDSSVATVMAMITNESAARRLLDCDVIFGCTDDNAGRLILSRFSTYFLVPIIDCGVLLSSDHEGILTGIDGRVTTLAPGQACLVCRGRIDLARASAELLTPDERIRRIDEGYAPALGRTEPAVVTFTTLVAATAISELLERLIGYGPEPRPNEVLLRCHEREISTNLALPKEGHYCHPGVGIIGRGDTQPFLGLTWQNG